MRAAEGLVFIPAPAPLVAGLSRFIAEMWPEGDS
jgi:hypothetical protein